MIKLVHDASEAKRRELEMFGITEAQVRAELSRIVGSYGAVDYAANMGLGQVLTKVQELIELPGQLYKTDIPPNLRRAVQKLSQVRLALYLADPIKLWRRGER